MCCLYLLQWRVPTEWTLIDNAALAGKTIINKLLKKSLHIRYCLCNFWGFYKLKVGESYANIFADMHYFTRFTYVWTEQSNGKKLVLYYIRYSAKETVIRWLLGFINKAFITPKLRRSTLITAHRKVYWAISIFFMKKTGTCFLEGTRRYNYLLSY